MDVGDRVFLKPRFYHKADELTDFGTIVEKQLFGTIPLFVVKWDHQPVPLQYSEFNLVPAILHEKYKAQVAEILRKAEQGDKYGQRGKNR